jgi:uncharacterized membrane protein YeaQ/YmgE (transglycosylase-associated protein family)
VTGAVAKLLMPGPDDGGLLSTSLLGVVGAMIGGLAASVIGLGAMRGFSLGAFALDVLGARPAATTARAVHRPREPTW